MGCWSSRPAETALLALCRSRKTLIREAIDHRYALAESHAAYFRSLAAVGDALLRHARSAVSASPEQSDSQAVTLPSSRKNNDGDLSAGSSATPLSHSVSDEGSHLQISSESEEEIEVLEEKRGVNPSFYYMRSSPATPNVVYGDLYEGFVNDPDYYYNGSVSPPRAAAAAAVSSSSPPPPPPQASSSSAWDFLDPFCSYEQFLPGYFNGQYGAKSHGSSSNSSEVRAREGIPDLEDETEMEGISDVKKGKMKAEDLETKEMNVVSGEKGSNGSSSTSSKKKGVTFEEGNSLVSERSGTSDGGFVEGNRDVVEALVEIKEEFNSAIVGSEEVSSLLEVGKMPYKARSKVFKVISSRIFVCIGFRMPSRRLFKHRRRLAATTMKSRSSNVEFEKHVSMKPGRLSSILEKLHLWEKKLYEEIKAEERLRGMYEKKMRTLKSLDDRGAELHKINATQVSVRSVRTKMSIAVTSVDVISRRMRTIMDEELQPQLIELVKRLTQMWKLLLGCHQKQLRAIVASKNYNFTIRTSFQGSVAEATMALELELQKWHASFDDWISSQQYFVDSLNRWLLKWLPKHRKETADGVAPFSPTAIGAPSLFILTNDWSQALNRLSEADVKAAIQRFTRDIRKLWESQDEEQKLHQKADFLSREYSAKLKSLHMDHGGRDLSIPDNENRYDLDSMKRRLDEVRAKHVETVKQVQEVGSASLSAGLIPIFKSLSSFSSEILRAYEAVRIPSSGGVGSN